MVFTKPYLGIESSGNVSQSKLASTNANGGNLATTLYRIGFLLSTPENTATFTEIVVVVAVVVVVVFISHSPKGLFSELLQV
jgi:hypothetical protein